MPKSSSTSIHPPHFTKFHNFLSSSPKKPLRISFIHNTKKAHVDKRIKRTNTIQNVNKFACGTSRPRACTFHLPDITSQHIRTIFFCPVSMWMEEKEKASRYFLLKWKFSFFLYGGKTRRTDLERIFFLCVLFCKTKFFREVLHLISFSEKA